MTATPPQAQPDTGRAGAPLALGLLAAGAQVAVAATTVLMGLQWGGWSHLLAVLQALAALVPAVWLALRRSWLVLLIPLASAALTAALFLVGTSSEAATACRDDAVAAAEQLDDPPGTDVRFRGEAANGCMARFTTDLPAEAVVAHYRSQFLAHGWQVRFDEGPAGITAAKDGITMNVQPAPQEGGLVLLRLDTDSPG